MTTVVLVGLAAVLVLLAAGIVLARRFQRLRPPTTVRPLRSRTVGDLVRERYGSTVGAILMSDHPEPSTAATAPLFTPPTPFRRGQAAEPAGRTAPEPAVFEAARHVLEDGVDAGDAPWRRADRMMGREPGASWETAPTPLVPEQEPAPADSEAPVEPPATAGSSKPADISAPAEPPKPAERPDPPQRQDPTQPQAGTPPPVDTAPSGSEPAPRTAGGGRDRPPTATSPVTPLVSCLRVVPDPEMTPLMGVPVFRASAGVPTPLPRVAVARVDEQVVSLLPASHPRPVLVVISGTPQTVWFRVVDREGEPVPDALVALFDDRGTEVDTAKTATDGSGDLAAPHSGRFLLVARADGFQPRAATVTVDDGPVELALLLPRSCRVVGCVRVGGEPLEDARVVASHEDEVVDEADTERDGTFSFDDLVEGSYTLSVTHPRGSATIRIRVAEGVEQPHVVDLAASAAPR
jgi:hypothetical protein